MDSLCSASVFVLMSDETVYIWIGNAYFHRYLTYNTYDKLQVLLSDELWKRLTLVHENTSSLDDAAQSVTILREGGENKAFYETITGGEVDVRPMVPLFTRLMKAVMRCSKPHEPRFYCIMEDEEICDFTNFVLPDREHAEEIESSVFKEIHDYEQTSLSHTGAYMLDLFSEVFVWVGKETPKHLRLYYKQCAMDLVQKMRHSEERCSRLTVSVVQEEYEPEIFKDLFDNWRYLKSTDF